MDVEFLKYKFQDAYDGVITKTKWQAGVRHVQLVYMWLAAVALGALRASAGVALLAMTDASRLNDSHVQIQEWGAGVQGAVLWSFLSGHALALLPAELCLARFGDKFVVTAVLLVNGSLTAAIPTIVNRGGWAALCNAYFLMGMTQPCLAPVNRALLDNWLPPDERQAAACFLDTGSFIGIIVGLPVSGWLGGLRLGWPLVAYAQATLALSLATLWALLTAGSPDQHHACSDSEKEYIKEASAGYRKKRPRVPWRGMARCRRLAGLALAHAAHNALFVFYLVDVPLYLKSTGLTLTQAMVPFVVLLIVYATTAPTVGWLLKSNLIANMFNVAYIKKVVIILGAVSTVGGLAAAPYVPAEWAHLRLAVLIATLGLLAFHYSNFIESVRDLSENYCGTLIVVTSAFASVVGAAVPLLTGIILRNHEDESGAWRVVFACVAAVYGACRACAAGGSRVRWDVRADGHNFAYHNTGLSADDSNQVELLDVCAKKTMESRPREAVA